MKIARNSVAIDRVATVVAMEALDVRRLLTFTSSYEPATDILTFQGDATSETFFFDQVTGGVDIYYNGAFAGTIDSSLPVQVLAVFGNGGNDTITIDAAITGDVGIDGGTGADSLVGGSGEDTIRGQDGVDTIFGNSGDDEINGGNQGDSIEGGAHNDLIHGDGGDDIVIGGNGDDVLYGDAGSDNLSGGADVDVMLGGISDDTLTGGAGNDNMLGEDGVDHFAAADGVVDTLNGGTSTDILDSYDNGIDVLQSI